MASYVPKTAWRATDINKRYGLHALGIQMSQRDWAVPKTFDTVSPRSYAFGKKEGGAPFAEGKKGFVIDVRSEAERRARTVKSQLPIHIDDLVSGAAALVLPRNKNAAITVVATGEQRSRNGFNALRRAGYTNVTCMDDVAYLRERNARLTALAKAEGKKTKGITEAVRQEAPKGEKPAEAKAE